MVLKLYSKVTKEKTKTSIKALNYMAATSLSNKTAENSLKITVL